MAFSIGGGILFCGLALYVASIALMLAHPQPVTIPVR
jgi:hypothetical protein